MDKIAELLEVLVTDLLDEYNLFLYHVQGRQIKVLRRSKGLTQKEYATLLDVPLGTLKNWDTDKVQMFKSTWERLFKNELAELPCDRTA